MTAQHPSNFMRKSGSNTAFWVNHEGLVLTQLRRTRFGWRFIACDGSLITTRTLPEACIYLSLRSDDYGNWVLDPLLAEHPQHVVYEAVESTLVQLRTILGEPGGQGDQGQGGQHHG